MFMIIAIIHLAMIFVSPMDLHNQTQRAHTCFFAVVVVFFCFFLCVFLLFRSLFSAKTTTFQCQLSSVGVDINQDSLYKRNGSTDDLILIVKYPPAQHMTARGERHSSIFNALSHVSANRNSSIFIYFLFVCFFFAFFRVLFMSHEEL